MSVHATTTSSSSSSSSSRHPYGRNHPSATFPHYPTPHSSEPIRKREYSANEVAASPTVERASWSTQVGHPPLSATAPRTRYYGQEMAFDRRSSTTDPVLGRRRDLDGAPPGTSPLEPLARGASAGGIPFSPGEPVQAFYEPDQRWYDARMIKIVPRVPKAADRHMPRNRAQTHASVVRFEDGFPGEHVVDDVRFRQMYPLNLS